MAFSRIRQAVLFLQHYVQAKRSKRFANRRSLEDWQNKQVRRLLDKVVPRSPYHVRRFEGSTYDKWRTLPVIEKADMMEHFDTLNTRGIGKQEAFRVAFEAEHTRNFSPTIQDVTVGLSSGTSGNRGVFLVSAQERAAWAGAMLGKVLPGPLWGRQKIAFFLRANSNLYETVNQGNMQFRFFDLFGDITAFAPLLQEFQPTILIGPPSVLRHLAEEQRKARMALRPDKVISVAEVLDPIDEQAIGDAFDQLVHQVYQCTEGFLAATCSYGTLHLNEDLLVIQKEYVDAVEGRFIPIITDFSRFTQPIIRYRLNDLLIEKKEACPCGSVYTALERVEGRCDDVFTLPSAKDAATLVTVFPDFLRRALITASEQITHYHLIQRSLDEIEVYLAPTLSMQTEVKASLDQVWEQFAISPPSLIFRAYEHKPSDKKLRRVERRFSL